MGKSLNTETNRVTLTLTAEQKQRLQYEADKSGFRSISALVGAIADGKIRVMTKGEALLLDYISREMQKQV